MRLTHRPDLRALLLGTVGVACSSNAAPDDTPPVLVAAAFTDAQTIRLTFSEPMANPGTVDTQAFRLSIGVRDVSSTVYYGLDYDGFDDYGGTDGSEGGPISDGDPTLDPTDPTDATDTDATGTDPTDPSDTTADPTADPTYDPSDGGYEEGGYEGGYAGPSETPIDGFTRPIPPLAIQDLDVASIAAVSGDATNVDLKLAASVRDTGACTALAYFTNEGLKSGLFVHYRPGATPLADAAENPLAAIGPQWVDARAESYLEFQGDFPNLNPYLPIPCP